MSAIETNELETWRLIVLDQHRERIALMGHPTGSKCLPRVQIPRWQRVAENITAAIRNEWDWGAICLFTLSPVASIAPDDRHCAVMEWVQRPRTDSSCVLVPIQDLTRDCLEDQTDFLMILHAVAELESRANEISAPFIQVGWLQELRGWIAESIRPRDLKLSGSFTQLNASPSFSLIRFVTSGPDVWFKAVGQPNRREFPITLELARLFPSFLPEIVAQKEQWNAWLSVSAGSRTLADTSHVSSWSNAAMALARLQLESVSHVNSILNAGSRDLRLQKLSTLAEPFFEAMRVVIGEAVRELLSEEKLGLLCIRVRDSIALLEDLKVSDTLGHLDLNPANIVLSQSGCKFLDWADAYIGHPQARPCHRKPAVCNVRLACADVCRARDGLC